MSKVQDAIPSTEEERCSGFLQLSPTADRASSWEERGWKQVGTRERGCMGPWDRALGNFQKQLSPLGNAITCGESEA